MENKIDPVEMSTESASLKSSYSTISLLSEKSDKMQMQRQSSKVKLAPILKKTETEKKDDKDESESSTYSMS